jgi:DNA primase
VVGEYVRLKKSGQNFTGLCPFHSEKTPSFAVHPVKQIYHCFGCGVGGDVFQFVMEIDKCSFPEAVRAVAEKSGIAVPPPRQRSPEERQENQQRTALVEIHQQAQTFFSHQLETTMEGKAARAYLEDRGLDAQAIARFGLGYAPSGGDVLLRMLRSKYPEKLLSLSGLVSGDSSGRQYDRFRRRITFPIANDSGKVVAFGGRALGDEQPKYLNSPETPIYSKSNILYNFHTAKEPIRREGFAVVVEGYMDAIALVRADILNVVATCGTSFADGQAGLLKKLFAPGVIPRLVISYDPDFAGSAAADRAMPFLQEKYGTDLSSEAHDRIHSMKTLEFGFELRLLQLPVGEDPDKFIRKNGADEYRKLLRSAPTYLDHLIARAREMDMSTGEGKLRAVNFLMPYLQRIPNRLLRSEWAGQIAQQLRIEEPVLRESIKRAAAERRDKVQTVPELVARPGKPVERRLIQLLFEAEGFRRQLAETIRSENLHRGLETERILESLVESILVSGAADQRPDAVALGAALEDRDRRLLFQIAFESGGGESTWEEAESCLGTLRRLRFETELAAIQAEIEVQVKSKSAESAEALRHLLERKQELSRRRSDAAH